MKVYEVTPSKGSNTCTEKEIAGVIAWLEISEPGETMVIKIKNMSESSYEALPEYEGP